MYTCIHVHMYTSTRNYTLAIASIQQGYPRDTLVSWALDPMVMGAAILVLKRFDSFCMLLFIWGSGRFEAGKQILTISWKGPTQ